MDLIQVLLDLPVTWLCAVPWSGTTAPRKKRLFLLTKGIKQVHLKIVMITTPRCGHPLGPGRGIILSSVLVLIVIATLLKETLCLVPKTLPPLDDYSKGPTSVTAVDSRVDRS